jgi:hypothetical protein
MWRSDTAAESVSVFGRSRRFMMNAEQIRTIAILLVALFIIWRFARPKPALRIVVADGQVQSHHGLPQTQIRRVIEFLEHDVALRGKVTVKGGRDAHGVWRIHASGNIDEGAAQQIRNFLKLVL